MAANQAKTPVQLARPARRSLGLMLAIIATGVLFGVWPLLEVYFLKRVDATAKEAFLMGGVEIDTWFWLQAIYGGAVLIICALAWWGRPPWIRYVLTAALLLPTVVYVLRLIETSSTPEDPIYGGQVQSTVRDVLRTQLPIVVIVPLYTAWYVNRAPARAFFRRSARPPVSANDSPGESIKNLPKT
ncbi:MAG: hypothetical protein JW966_07105 [Anaerolineae bacterium]|nr:hypothetical protein [Anaerolineae bacterium]